MDSFKVYLPSNASTNVFPENTPTNYRTQFQNTIRLEGEWEVGVESILYSSHIEEKGESATINLSVRSHPSITVNSIYPYEFNFSTENKWMGYKAFAPQVIEKDPDNIENILDCLNRLNKVILSSEKQKVYGPVFQFKVSAKGEVSYHGYCNSFTLEISPYLGHLLGFGNHNIFSGGDVIKSHTPRKAGKRKLTIHDYHIKYFDANVLQREKRIYIKRVGEYFKLTKTIFLQHWEKLIQKFHGYDIRIEFTEDNKLILHNHRNDLGIIFSPELATIFLDHFYSLGKVRDMLLNRQIFQRRIISLMKIGTLRFITTNLT